MFRRRSLVVSVVLLAAVVPFPGPAAADTSTSSRVASLQAQIGEASRAEVVAMRAWSAVHTRRVAFDTRLARLDGRIGAAEARVAAATRQADRLGAAALRLQQQAQRTRARLRIAKARFRKSAAELYKTGSEASVAYTMVNFEVSSPSDAGSGSVYLQRVAAVRHDALSTLNGVRRRDAQLHRALQERQLEVVAARQSAAGERQRLGGLRAQQARQRDAVATQEARENAIVSRFRSRKGQYTAELNALQQTSTQVSALLYDLQINQPRAASFHASRPVPGPVTSPFGMREHPILGVTRMHTGIDFAAAYGDPIHAAAAGTVVWAGPRGGYGNAVVIDHGGQFATLYAHSSAWYVTVGEHVSAGETVAAIGASGMATGPHLHFEVRILGYCVNPAPYLG
jgi:murein DD-endopeptidase MepM/ murein hydrolase activator NlpD